MRNLIFDKPRLFAPMLSTFGGGSVRGFGGAGAAGGGGAALATHPHDISIPSSLSGVSDDDLSWVGPYSNASVHTMFFIRDGVYKGDIMHHDNGDRDLVRFSHPNADDAGVISSSGTISSTTYISNTSNPELGRNIATANDGSWIYSGSNGGNLRGWKVSNINGAWNPSGISNSNYTRSYTSITNLSSFTALSFNYDGSRAFGLIYGNGGGNKMFEFSNVSNYDISSSSNYQAYQFSGSQTHRPQGLMFSWKWFDQGTKAMCTTLDNELCLMTFSTAYDFSTITFADRIANLTSVESESVGSYYIDFDVTADGSKIVFAMYGNSSNRFFRQWSL
jgi:hypothetical protein